jgi:hypothetical protein
MLMYGRIGGISGRIERLLVRFRAGRLWQLTPRVAVKGRTIRRKPAVRLPRRFGWLVLAGRHEAVGYGLQLQAVLNTPDMVELLNASPQAVRILRPLCRALAMELPTIMKPERGERKPRARKPRVKPEPFRIPFPRGVLSAARRQGFGKMC